MERVFMVNHGVDTLVLNAYHTDDNGKPLKRELDRSLHEQFNHWKKEAQGMHDAFPTPLAFNGATLHMQPNGAGQGQWPWMLKSKDITLYISGGQWNGIASVRLGSDYLWSCRKVLDAISNIQVLLDDLFHDEMYLQVSLVDLCVDIAGWRDIDRLDRFENFITRAKKRTGYAESEMLHDGVFKSTPLASSIRVLPLGKIRRGG